MKIRFYIGVLIVAVAVVFPFIAIPVVTILPLSVELKATAMAVAVAGVPEVLLVVAGVVMGKENLGVIIGRLLHPLKVLWANLAHRIIKFTRAK
ncbi:hypothetical protein [Vibrio sp. 10N.261.51.F12]|uniref:hypothetical protein n=1 Tax=Vibrio sp. 10N.261.51.F12 TaxID=3229679 RepID=UPI00355278F5